jgi:L-asparaginase II
VAHEILVSLTRGNLEESHHHGAYCVVEDGAVVRSRGDIGAPVFYRSSAKPIQAIAVVESGAPDRYGWTDAELAVVVGSHSGSPAHAGAAKSILDKCGESPDLLRCGGHRPLGREVHDEYVRRGYVPGRLEDNCSGKHAGMIAAAKALGLETETYYRSSHAVQQENLANVALLAGVAPEDVLIGTDGCAVPCFAVPLRAMAHSAAQFATPDELPGGKAAAARRIAAAVCAHPEMVAGAVRFDTRLIRATNGALIAKEGAEGVQIIGLYGRRIGIAIKIDDGAKRAVHAVAAALLADLGVVKPSEISELYPRQVCTREGSPVGVVKVRL